MLLLSDFVLHRPDALADVLELRGEHGAEAALYAGGTELLLAMKMGVLDYGHLIDVKRVPGLRGIERGDGIVRIGAAATHREIETDPLVRRELPVLARLAGNVANVRVRAAGTLGGNLAFAEPHADPPALLVALGAWMRLAGPDGDRTMPVEDFVAGPYETELGDEEVIEAIEVPLPADGVRAVYRKFQVLERPTVGVAAAGSVRDGAWAEAPTVVVGAVDERPIRVGTGALAGAACDDEAALADLEEAARDAVDPVDDLSGSADYKRHLTGVLVRRALADLARGGDRA